MLAMLAHATSSTRPTISMTPATNAWKRGILGVAEKRRALQGQRTRLIALHVGRAELPDQQVGLGLRARQPAPVLQPRQNLEAAGRPGASSQLRPGASCPCIETRRPEVGDRRDPPKCR